MLSACCAGLFLVAQSSQAVEIPKPTIIIPRPSIPRPNIPRPRIAMPSVPHRTVSVPHRTVPVPHRTVSTLHPSVRETKPIIQQKPTLLANGKKLNEIKTESVNPNDPLPGITFGKPYSDGSGGTITYYNQDNNLTAVDCNGGICITFSLTNLTIQNGVTYVTATGSLGGNTASGTFVVGPNGSLTPGSPAPGVGAAPPAPNPASSIPTSTPTPTPTSGPAPTPTPAQTPLPSPTLPTSLPDPTQIPAGPNVQANNQSNPDVDSNGDPLMTPEGACIPSPCPPPNSYSGVSDQDLAAQVAANQAQVAGLLSGTSGNQSPSQTTSSTAQGADNSNPETLSYTDANGNTIQTGLYDGYQRPNDMGGTDSFFTKNGQWYEMSTETVTGPGQNGMTTYQQVYVDPQTGNLYGAPVDGNLKPTGGTSSWIPSPPPSTIGPVQPSSADLFGSVSSRYNSINSSGGFLPGSSPKQ
jgi:hypothetical protein